ncbi:hypothetical protein GOP47_0026140 [Adiantum capillus-veneris]|uniref:Leucine-rich repeat-containing N-terminal plant-type domain-containing protein n=1 Tax=Adiantum capillus-veneris TaxID=13818 RepID=A0A9D4U447_ADICA|nr:hypothetical protein GOP47_0026140 [Adiantum capillus-veneris]
MATQMSMAAPPWPAAAEVILSLLGLLFVSSTCSMSTPAISFSELSALLELKARLTNSAASEAPLLRAWTSSNWNNSCKSWAGVTCAYVSGQSHVAGINLAGSGFAGSLTPLLGNLTFMSHLNLSSNLLTGGIPTELSRCSSLRVLDLNHNRLTGHIPPSLSSLSSLQVLRLCANNLSGHIPPSLFTNCTSLRKLSLCQNGLTGSITTLKISPQLQRLYLWGNHVTGTFPPSLMPHPQRARA